MKINRFENIEAWQLARELTRKVYELTKKPRFARDFGRTNPCRHQKFHQIFAIL